MRTHVLCAVALLALAGCQTPERRAVRQQVEELKSSNAALKAQVDSSVTQSKMQAADARRQDLTLLQALSAEQAELRAKVADLEKKAGAGQAAPAEAAPGTQAPGTQTPADPELQKKLLDAVQDAQSRMQKLEDQLATAQAQAEAAQQAQTATQRQQVTSPTTAASAGNWHGKALPLTKFVGADGKLSDLGAYTGKNPVVLVFMKGYYSGGVCVYCTRQTTQLAQSIEQFKAAGAEVFVVFPGPEKYIETFVESVRRYQQVNDPKYRLPFQVLLDVDANASKVLGIAGDLAHPTSFVLDKQGVVRYQYVGRTIHDRPSAEALLKEVAKLGEAGK
ncbi:MAG: hypothetical protein AMXMBFR7_31710 [Planctomycetota bacterium]